jgi:hypothetical protein
MRKSINLLVVLLLISFTMNSFAQDSGGSSNILQQNMPETVAGYRVMGVLTPDSTPCMPSGSQRFVLQTSEPNVETFLQNARLGAIREELTNLGLITTGGIWNISFVGPNAAREGIISGNERWSAHVSQFGCIKLTPMNTDSDGTEYSIPSPDPGRAVFENVDADSFTDDNAQSVNLVAPSSVGNSQNGSSALLNNVRTDSGSLYVLQNGLNFQGGSGFVIWTDTTWGYDAQMYEDIPYSAGSDYWFGITFTDDAWFMCAYPHYDTNLYRCVGEPFGSGTTLERVS